MSVNREELHRLIEALPVTELPIARRFLEYLRDTEEELSPEDLEAVNRGLEDIKAGRYVTLEEYEKGRRP